MGVLLSGMISEHPGVCALAVLGLASYLCHLWNCFVDWRWARADAKLNKQIGFMTQEQVQAKAQLETDLGRKLDTKEMTDFLSKL
jgi:hypothetical protein